MNLTYDELMMLCIYNTGSRAGVIDALSEMRTYLEPDEEELLSLTDTVIGKLTQMSDADFEALDLIPDFDEEEDLDAG